MRQRVTEHLYLLVLLLWLTSFNYVKTEDGDGDAGGLTVCRQLAHHYLPSKAEISGFSHLLALTASIYYKENIIVGEPSYTKDIEI